jgi:hypothetical protein
MSATRVGSKDVRISTETTSQPKASNALPTDLVPQNSSNKRGIFYKACDFRKPDTETLARLYHPNELAAPIVFQNTACGYAEKEAFKMLEGTAKLLWKLLFRFVLNVFDLTATTLFQAYLFVSLF